MVIEIKNKLKQIEKTVLWLSDATGISPTSIHQICSGKKEPRKKNLESICNVLNEEIEIFNLENGLDINKLEVFEFKKMYISRQTYRLKSIK